MNIYLETLGCQMNRLDSELIVGLLQQAGHDMVTEAREADVMLYNTCSVREHAENKVYSRIGADARRKREGRNLLVGVLGCMAQREGGALTKRFGCVDLVCGPGQLHRLPALIAKAAKGHRGVQIDPTRVEPRDLASEAELDGIDVSRDVSLTGGASAFVRVMRGCNKFCSYCIVPFVRGAERSRDPKAIYEEVSRLVDAGKTEITLIGQTVNSYRHLAGETTTRFSDLLMHLSPITGLRRLRFVTSHPVDFTRDILEAMRDGPNICEYIHVPPQSGSDTMLRAMNRGYTRAQYDALIDQAREIVPGVAFAGDFIVGFPGETQADHDASADLLRRTGFKNSFIFKYSPRPGTNAAKKLTDDIPEAVKKARNNELLALQREVGLAHHQSYIGQSLEILVTGPSARSAKQADVSTATTLQLMGRSRGDHIVLFDGPTSLIGDYAHIQIADATDLSLFGQQIDPPQ